MNTEGSSIINIAIVGGGDLCREILEKTVFSRSREGVSAPILAVADPDPSSPGIQLAEKLGLLTFPDYHDLYDPRHHIHLIIILTPDARIFYDILATRPTRIRLLSYNVFSLFWQAIGREERKLREQKKAMETIVNGIRDFILVLSPEMKILEANESFLEKMGHDHENVIGKKCHEILRKCSSPCSDAQDACPLVEVLALQGPARQIQRYQREDGTIRYYEINVYPIWEKGGKISKYIYISHDITERKKAEEEITRRLEKMVEERTRELEETHTKLLHSDKMASLGKLSASVVHEINNPIAGILNLSILGKRILSEEEWEEERGTLEQYLGLIETETRRISRIVSNLLAFSRQSKLEINRIDLNSLIDRVLMIHTNLLKLGDIKINTHLDDTLPLITGSGDQLQQVFMNFISNAAEAMEGNGGGTLSITTRHHLKENQISILIEDTGIGVPPKDIPRLFEPFFTTKKEGKGVGLGLSVAYGIVKDHGGSIEVHSTVNEGTRFKLVFPLKRETENQSDLSS
jgi:PAS domain S-box-containing protein